MNRVFDRVILLLILAISAYCMFEEKCVYVILVGIIFSFFELYFMDTNVHIILMGALGLLILAKSIFIPLIVLMMYETLYKVFKKCDDCKSEIYIISVVIGILIIQYICGVENIFFRKIILEPVVLFIMIIDVILSMYLSYISVNYMSARVNNIKLRDDNEEFRQSMFQKSVIQRQQQDNEILMATLKERNRIAREIHDNVGHMLSRSILQMGALQTIYKDEPLNSYLKQVSSTLNESMNSIRKSVHDIHNEGIDLEKSINDIISKNNNVITRLDYDVNSDMTKEIKYCIISMINEAFENVRKHSDGTEVDIVFIEHPRFYKFIFKDNGSPGHIEESGIGLHNMQSRIEEMGGKIEFMNSKGFKIFATIPKK